MSELRVDSVKSKGGGAPDLPKGVTISGIATAATLGATTVDVSNVNVSGVVTSATLNGPLLSTGTPTLGLGVTINSSGLVVSGVATAGIVSATTLYGDGSNLTGVGASIAPLFYNPDASDSSVSFGTGIGITFNQQIKAGTGNITIRETNASGTVVENFGVGSSVTISENRVTFTPTTNLSESTIYHLSYPSGCFTNNEGTDYVGTAYTFQARTYDYQLWMWGRNNNGQLGQNTDGDNRSSPIQVPGTNWRYIANQADIAIAIKTDGSLWSWGNNAYGALGLNQNHDNFKYSSPVQVGTDTTWKAGTLQVSYHAVYCCKTDGTLWSWGYNSQGQLGQNQPNNTNLSSPTQISGTTWKRPFTTGTTSAGGIKTDGTLWCWGTNAGGALGQNNRTAYSSPVQIPGTTWANSNSGTYNSFIATKTDGTLWALGENAMGVLGQNDLNRRSSPVQIPGTTWSTADGALSGSVKGVAALKTDGTLWTWGYNKDGALGHNEGHAGSGNSKSSPVQVPGTTWDSIRSSHYAQAATKTDGTLWVWGSADYGAGGFSGLGLYSPTSHRSSPVQIPGTDYWKSGHNGSPQQRFTSAIIKRS